jgi:hypothetical protein
MRQIPSTLVPLCAQMQKSELEYLSLVYLPNVIWCATDADGAIRALHES